MSAIKKYDSVISEHITVVLPVFKNAEMLEALSQQLCDVLSVHATSFDLLFVNDASPDDSLGTLRGLSKDAPHITVLDLPQNVGQQRAILEGLKLAKGAFVVVMDADLQDPPAAIADLLQQIRRHHCDAVFATRVGQYQSLFRMMTSWVFKSILCSVTNLPPRAGCYVLLSREMVDKVTQSPQRHFYLLTAIARSGLKVRGIPVQRQERVTGRSAYSTLERLRLSALYFRSLVR